jgi:hypothetical protein
LRRLFGVFSQTERHREKETGSQRAQGAEYDFVYELVVMSGRGTKEIASMSHGTGKEKACSDGGFVRREKRIEYRSSCC